MSGQVSNLSAGPAPLRLLAPIGVLIGVCAGAGAWLLKWLCANLRSLAFVGTDAAHGNWQLILWPVAGVLLTSLLARYAFRQQVDDAVKRLSRRLTLGRFSLSLNILWETIGGCALTVGLGASAGTESPIAYAGASIGSNIGKIFGVNRQTLRLLVIFGAGAGIAAIFKAPLGGFFFVVEGLRIEMKVKPVVALGTCCLAAALTAYVLSGCTPDVRFDTPLPPGPHIYFAIILMGALIGLYSRWYNLCFRSTERWLPRLSPWPRHILSALLLGSAVLLLPGLYGDGYTLMESLLAGSDRGLLLFSFFASEHSALALVLACLAMLLLKGALVALANLGGGVAGDFSPTLFAGALAGWLFAFASDWLLGTHMPASAMVCIGMGAAMAGILQSPLMAIFITIEATMAYSMLLPVTLAAYVAFIVARSRSGRADGTMDRVRKPLQNSPVRSKIEGVLHRL